MFSLRIHSVDTNNDMQQQQQQHRPESAGGSHDPPPIGNPKFEEELVEERTRNNNLQIQETRGIVHLYRNVSKLPASLDVLPVERSTLVFVLAVPNHIAYEDFLHLCDSYVEHFTEIRVVRNDGMDDRYSILIKLDNQNNTDSFYRYSNGKHFSSTEAEVCHILFTVDVQFTESLELAGTPPSGSTELPTCPVCLERLDQDVSGILTTVCDHSFHCSCISKWTGSSCPVCRFCQLHPEKSTCSVCETSENLWICVICGFVGCGRYKEGHAIKHWKDTRHCYSLDLETQRVWDYVGDNYVHRINQSKTDGKLVGLNSHCRSVKDDCGNYKFSGDSGINSALFSSRVEVIVDEYNRLLASQLENQKEYYESLLVEQKEKREKAIAESVGKAVNLKLQSIQLELETCIAENESIASMNEDLIKNQDVWRKKVNEIEEREKTTLKDRDEKILDLEEQIRDLTVYVEAQKTLRSMPNGDDIKGGTLLPMPLQSSPNSRRSNKTRNRRRV